MKVRKIVALSTILAASATLLTGCDWSDKVSEPWNDAPRARTFENAADIVTMPDGFSNLSTKCGPGGMRYTVAYHGDAPYGSISVVADPTCPK